MIRQAERTAMTVLVGSTKQSTRRVQYRAGITAKISLMRTGGNE
jgi:hypothetical protein